LDRFGLVHVRLHYARSRTLLTGFACHCPPRAVATPRAFSAVAISLNVFAPAFWASLMIEDIGCEPILATVAQ
jgi:hypothetical protein